jgi:hypothetical protein
MPTAALWLLALMLSAPGDLIRCVGADGQVRWQDRACPAGERSDRVAGPDTATDPQSLRRRIEALRGSAPRPTPQRAQVGAPPRANTPISEAALAVCSERVLACAHQDRARMDACVAAIPRCDRSGTPCCPTECTSAYARERRAGSSAPDAVYLALLAADAGGCGPRGAPDR